MIVHNNRLYHESDRCGSGILLQGLVVATLNVILSLSEVWPLRWTAVWSHLPRRIRQYGSGTLLYGLDFMLGNYRSFPNLFRLVQRLSLSRGDSTETCGF